jgi:hypothetical protein
LTWPTVRTPLTLALAAAALAAAFSGCGPAADGDPTTGYVWSSPDREDVETVYVPMWTRGKGEYRRELEFRLTEALVKRIESETPYKVADRGVADTELTGTIQRVSQRVLSFHPGTGRAREIQLTVHVDFTWTDLRTGRTLVERKDFTAAAEYIPPAPLEEDFFLGGEDALNRVAERIVRQLQRPW